MIVDVLVWQITTSYTGSWNSNLGPVSLTAGNYLHVRVDNVTFDLSVDYRSSPDEGGGSYLGTLTEGPNLFFGFDGAATLITAAPFWQKCDGTVLRKIGTNNLFPYATLSYNEGALECAVAPVCDLNISLVSTTVASGPSTPDGAVEVAGTSSNGTIKYSLNPAFNYATEGQTSGIFTGLLPNLYTIYAKDAIGCTASINFEIKITVVYNPRLRLHYRDKIDTSGRIHKTDIFERAYTGDVENVLSGATPGEVRYKADPNDPDLALIESKMDIELMNQIPSQFRFLFEGDDRKFKVVHYVDEEVYWTGFIIPEFYSEPYIFEPFPVTVKATDGIAELKDADFVDEYGNLYKDPMKAIKVISEILKKAGLNLSIRAGINIFDTAMDNNEVDSDNDPLDQAYIDPHIYQDEEQAPKKSDEVIKTIPEPFRARIFQSMGYWWITRQSDAVGTFTFRQFDFEGEYESDDSINPVINIDIPRNQNRQAWVNLQQKMSTIRNYGYFKVTHDLARDNNFIDEGRFEEQDVIDIGSGNKMFKNWNFFQAQAGAKYGFEKIFTSGSSKGAFYLDLENVIDDQADNILYSAKIPFEMLGLLKTRFKYSVTPRYANLPWVRLGWSVEINPGPTAIGLGSLPKWVTDRFPPNFSYESTDPIINDLYVTNFNTFNDFELIGRSGFGGNPGEGGYIEIKFYMHNHYGRDFDDIDALRDFDPETILVTPLGKRVMVGNSPNNSTLFYTLTASTDSDDGYATIRPDNYASHGFLWKLDKEVTLGVGSGLVNKFLLDDVGIEFIYLEETNSVPTEPPANIFDDQLVNQFNKANLKKEIVLGDLIRFNSEYSLNEKALYKGYFRLEDGTPTTFWTRDGVIESKKLIRLLKEDLRDQFSAPRKRLTGQLAGDVLLHYVNCIQDMHGGGRFMHTDFSFNMREGIYDINVIEVLTGEGGDPPFSGGEFEELAFSDAFNTGI